MRALTRALMLIGAVAAMIAGLTGEPTVAATFAAVSAIGALDVMVRKPPPPVGASIRPTAELAEEIITASSHAEVENLVRHEIDRFAGIDVQWVAVTTVMSELRHDVSTPIQRELARVLSLLEGAETETVVQVASGEAHVFPCGAGSGLVLVVATGRPVPHDVALELADLAVLIGFGSTQLAINEQLDARRIDSRFEELVRFSSDAILITDTRGTIKYAAPSSTAVLGYLSGALDGMSVSDLVIDGHTPHLTQFLAEVARKDPRQPTTAELQVNRADGRTIDVDVVGANLLDNPDVHGLVVTMRDVTARRDLEAQLRHQAFHDALTGLANRALFRDRLDRAMRQRRGPSDARAAVAFLDLDDFKNVNDGLGHDVGDELLRTVANRISGSLRGADTAARLGGDEFALLLESAGGPDEVVATVQRVVDAVCVPLELADGTTVAVRSSAGVAIADHESTGSEDLLRNADMAMYKAKLRGKAQVVLFESGMRHAAVDRLALTAELDAAIENEHVTVDFQPIVDLDTGAVVGVEALPRWVHPTRGALAPQELLQLAEETGLVVSLGRGVLRQGLAALAEWRAASPQDVFLSVDLSPRLLRAPGFRDTVRSELEQLGLPPSLLVFDITARVLTTGEAIISDGLAALRATGVRLAIDDLGSGAVSVANLRDIEFDQVKIGGELVSRLSDERGRAVTAAIVTLAESLSATPVAVDVNSGNDLAAVRAVGCRYARGRQIAAPSGARTVGFMLQQPLSI